MGHPCLELGRPGPASAALSSRSVWAVGSRWYLNADRTLIEHWNGSTWKLQAAAIPG